MHLLQALLGGNLPRSSRQVCQFIPSKIFDAPATGRGPFSTGQRAVEGAALASAAASGHSVVDLDWHPIQVPAESREGQQQH